MATFVNDEKFLEVLTHLRWLYAQYLVYGDADREYMPIRGLSLYEFSMLYLSMSSYRHPIK